MTSSEPTVDVGVRPPMEAEYLGDGLYASFDGFHIWLHVGDHRKPGVAALQPAVYAALRQYAAKVWRPG